MKNCSPVLQGRYPTTKTEASEAAEAVHALSVKASSGFIATEVYTLLSHYFVNDLPESVQAKIASQWHRELDGLPAWAIEAACAWWVGRNNDKRGKKPLPGDISARATMEMSPVRFAAKQVEAYQAYGDTPPAWYGHCSG